MTDVKFLKVVCESVSPFEKEILVDKNCKDIDELSSILKANSKLLSEDNVWVIYPMSITI